MKGLNWNRDTKIMLTITLIFWGLTGWAIYLDIFLNHTGIGRIVMLLFGCAIVTAATILELFNFFENGEK